MRGNLYTVGGSEVERVLLLAQAKTRGERGLAVRWSGVAMGQSPSQEIRSET